MLKLQILNRFASMARDFPTFSMSELMSLTSILASMLFLRAFLAILKAISPVPPATSISWYFLSLENSISSTILFFQWR